VLLNYISQTHGFSLQNQVAELLFNAYFTDGIYPSIENLMTLIAPLSIDHSELKSILESQFLEKEVLEEAQSYSGRIGGVPFFVINGKQTVSGAQEAKIFEEIFKKI